MTEEEIDGLLCLEPGQVISAKNEIHCIIPIIVADNSEEHF
jgi:hypothetical protein